MNNKPYKKLDIPIWIIVIAFILNFPLGIILLILRSISIPSGASSFSESKKQDGVKNNNIGIKQDTPRSAGAKPGKKSAGEIISIILSVLFALSLANVVFDISIPIAISEIVKAGIFAAGIGGSVLSYKVFKSRRVRYDRYKEWIGDAEYFNISTLSYAFNEPEKKIVKDLQRLAQSGTFGPGAFIDSKRMMFFKNPKAAEKYEEFQTAQKYNISEDEKPAEDKVERDEYRQIILKIRRLNDEIEDIAVSDRIYKIEEQTQNIFDYIKEHPEKKNNIRTFMNYYLPTTLKLLESYAKIEHVGVAGENMQKSKENIEKILDMLVFGFVQQVDQLYASEYVDISSDIEVLETMMKKDGLTENKDFDIKSFGASAGEAKQG